MSDAMRMQMLMFASSECVARPAAIRWLYVNGMWPEDIADACLIPLETVRTAINNIP